MKNNPLYRATGLLVLHAITRHVASPTVGLHVQQREPMVGTTMGDPVGTPSVMDAPTTDIDALLAANPAKSLAELDKIYLKWLKQNTAVDTQAANPPAPAPVPQAPKQGPAPSGA